MADTNNESEDLAVPLVVIYVLIAVVVVAIIATCACVAYLRRRRRTPLTETTILCMPPEGEYVAPLTVSLESTAERDILLYVTDITASGAATPSSWPKSSEITSDGSAVVVVDAGAVDKSAAVFMKYTEPLRFAVSGTYLITAYCQGTSSSDITAIHRFRFVVDGTPAAPIIVPSCGEVTSRTMIRIQAPPGAPHASLRYSVNGEAPTTPYGGPFCLHGAARLGDVGIVTIRAIAISNSGRWTSDEARADLGVIGSKAHILDESIGAPTAMVDLLSPQLYFTHANRSAPIFYSVEYITGMRVGSRHASGGGGVLFDKQRPVVVERDVATVTAWATDPQDASRHSRKVTYDASLADIISEPPATSSDEDPPSTKKKSSKHGPLPAPSIFVSCADVILSFDEPPPNALILYTLDGSEPELGGTSGSTRTFRGLQPLRLTRCESHGVHLVARYFIEEEDVVRFGKRFARQFAIR